MRRLFFIVIPVLIFLASRYENRSRFVYDPTIPYPVLNPGDFWPDKFDQRGLQNAVIYRDRIYCNTIDVGGDGNFLYCLNPQNGLVVWRTHVDAFASQPASFQDDSIIYCSYLGDISTFSNEGKILWKGRFDHPYDGHWVDTVNSKLLVKAVYWKYVSVYDIKSGKLISETENDSLQRLIELKIKNERLTAMRKYRFIRAGAAYTIKCSPSGPDETGEYKIEISK
ncbi:hypothetical protein ACTHGU_01705 [Chitinophagaceae bacterium MMS25-I14]